MYGLVGAGALFDLVQEDAHGDLAHFADGLFDCCQLWLDDGGDGVVTEANYTQLVRNFDADAFGVQEGLDGRGIIDAEDGVGGRLQR